MKRRLDMRITTIRQRTIASAAVEALRLSCQACEREVEMLTNGQAMRILGVDPRTLDQLVAVGKVHTVQTVSGNVWICKESLFLR